MKICLVHNFYQQYGGEDEVVKSQEKLLKAYGHDVFSFFVYNSEIKTYSKCDKLRLLKTAYNSPKTKKMLTDVITRFKPDIVHVHNVYPIISPVIYKVLHDNEIPMVQTLHNYRFICPNGMLYNQGKICTKCLDKKNLYQCGFNKCYHDNILQSFWYADIISKGQKWFKYINRFIALNDFVKNMMIKKGYEGSKINILPNYTTYCADIKEEKTEKYFLYIGRLSQEKGVKTLVKASDIYQGKTKIYFAGNGALSPEVASHKAKTDYIGFIHGFEKYTMIKNAKAVIIPSEWYETFGMGVIESFSQGTPVIASKIGGMQSIIDEGRNGLLFEPGNAQDLADKMKILDNNSERDNMSKNAIKTYKEKFTPEIHYEGLMKIYNELV